MKWRLIPILTLLVACVDRIEFKTAVASEQFVVEGTISDQPGPYTVLLSKVFSNSFPSRSRVAVTDAQIDLYEDDVMIDTFTEQEDGVYRTSSSVLGRVGHSYYIVIRKVDGTRYTSEPETLMAVGEFDNVQHEFQAATPKDRFNIYVDSYPVGAESYTRWRVNGTYRVISFPKLAIETLPNLKEIPAPLPCSGWRWIPSDPDFNGGIFEQFGPCTCCECWISDSEASFHISDPYLRNIAGYQHVKVGEVLITPRTFFDRYRVEIEQVSMTKNTHEFFRLLKAQADGVGSLFQPSFGEIRGNISSDNPNESVLGLFWATSVVRQSFFLEKSDVPYKVAPIDTIPDNCNVVGKSTYTKPDFWP